LLHADALHIQRAASPDPAVADDRGERATLQAFGSAGTTSR
jgi:hypothetical protein